MRLEVSDTEIRQLLEILYQRYHYDFRQYAPASLKRRLQQALTHFHCSSLSQLEQRVLADENAFPRLLEYLTVQVSDLFRDPEFFLALRQQVIPLLATYPSLKLWVAGCSTGEEAYSFAILLAEEGAAGSHAYLRDRYQRREFAQVAEGRLFAGPDATVHDESSRGRRSRLAVRLLSRCAR